MGALRALRALPALSPHVASPIIAPGQSCASNFALAGGRSPCCVAACMVSAWLPGSGVSGRTSYRTKAVKKRGKGILFFSVRFAYQPALLKLRWLVPQGPMMGQAELRRLPPPLDPHTLFPPSAFAAPAACRLLACTSYHPPLR